MCPTLLLTLETRRGISRFEPSVCLRDGVAFDAVTDHGARRVGFDVVDAERSASGPGAGGAHQLDLAVAGRRGDVAPRGQAFAAVGGAGGVDRGRLDHGMNGIPVPFGRFEGLDCENECTFRAHVAVGFRVEGAALALGTDDPHEVEAAAHPAAAQEGDGPHQRLIAVAALERIQRRVQGAQARGARRAVSHRRPHQVEVVRDPIGEHREADAGDGVLVDAVQRAPVRHRRHLSADEYSGKAVAQRLEVPSRAFDGLPRTVQQHSYLRLRLSQFVVGHAEERSIEEQLVAVTNESFVGARQTPRSRELAYGTVAPAIASAYGFLDDFPFLQHVPEVGVRPDAARHAVAVSDDGDCIPGSFCIHCVLVLSTALNDPARGDTPVSNPPARSHSPNRSGEWEPCDQSLWQLRNRNSGIHRYTDRWDWLPIPSFCHGHQEI